MLNIKLSYIVTHITLTLGGLLVLVHVAVTTEQLEVKQDAKSQNKLFVELMYTDETVDANSITDTDYQVNCFCRIGGSVDKEYVCTRSESRGYENIVNIRWSPSKQTIVTRKPGCSNESYSFNVTTNNIKVGLERNEDGDELNVTLVCADTSKHIYVNDVSQQSDRVKLGFSKQSGNENVILEFNCRVATTTTTSSTQSSTTETTTPKTTISSMTTLKTNPPTNQNSTELNEQDLILMVVIPVVAVVVIIIVIIIVVVICLRRKRKSSAPAMKYHVPPTDPNYNRRSAIDEESDYNILGERVPVHCDEDDYDCPYSQNTKPRKLPVKTQPEGSTYEDVDHLDLKDQLDSSPGSNNSTEPLHQPDPSQLYSVVQKDRKPEDDQGVIMVENDLYE